MPYLRNDWVVEVRHSSIPNELQGFLYFKDCLIYFVNLVLLLHNRFGKLPVDNSFYFLLHLFFG